MWRSAFKVLVRVVVAAVILVGLAIAGLFASDRLGSYHAIYDCEGLVKERATGNQTSSTAHLALERFHWFKLRVGPIAGMARIEMTTPALFNIFYVYTTSDQLLTLNRIPGSGQERGDYAGGLSLLSRTLVYEPFDGFVFDGACTLRGEEQ